MTPGIGSSGANSAARQAALSARPQVQTRRVSVKLGPLGISYSTDQVLWGSDGGASAPGDCAPEASASPFVAAEAAEAPPVHSVPRVGSWKAGAAAAADSGSPRLDGDFSAALAQAWNSLSAEFAATATYTGTGALRDSSGRVDAEGAVSGAARTGAAGRTGASAQPATAGSTAQAQECAAQGALGQSPIAQADRPEGKRPAAALVRRAIGAYLACAEGFAATRPMLQVTA